MIIFISGLLLRVDAGGDHSVRGSGDRGIGGSGDEDNLSWRVSCVLGGGI